MFHSTNCAAQPGTRDLARDICVRLQLPGASRILLLLGVLTGCTEPVELGSDAGHAGWPDASDTHRQDTGSEPDGEQPDTGSEPDGEQPEGCEQHTQRIQSFVATHRSCDTDADCVIVGDCSHADFQAVAREFEAEAKDLVLDDVCRTYDGPTYHAVCRAGSCERVQSVDSCGDLVEHECPSGTDRYEGGSCAAPPTLRDGCYRACDVEGDDASCAAGFSCQQTSINPCPSPTPGGAPTCDACSAASLLCLPAPACQVELSLAFNGSTAGRVFTGRSAELQLWLENRTDEAIPFSFDVPCHGPGVQGLGDYDLWQQCLAGACLEDPIRTELTLAPREKRLWRSAVLDLEPSECNAQGLPSGKYTPTFVLTNVEGATTCGPAPTSLLTGSEARR